MESVALAFPAMTADELNELRRARALLEGESLAVRVTELLGQPLEKGLALLPEGASASVQRTAQRALDRALRVALSTLTPEEPRPSADRLHRIATVASGAVGGFFGLPGLAVELPVTTVLMFRSIADIARSEGFDLASSETRIACLEVFALGGSARADAAAETAYYAVRATLAKALADAASHIAQRGLSREGAPVLLRALTAVAARFGVVVEEKVALGAVPVVGAVSGSLINNLFMDHFQRRARGHFVVRRLEDRHGFAVVRRAYEALGPTIATEEPSTPGR